MKIQLCSACSNLCKFFYIGRHLLWKVEAHNFWVKDIGITFKWKIKVKDFKKYDSGTFQFYDHYAQDSKIGQ